LDSKKVALKVIRLMKDSLEYEKVTKECSHEALTWYQLPHKYIVPFLGISKDVISSRLSLVSPWMENGNIMQYLEQNPSANRITLMIQVAEALAFIHSRKFTHGDIKGANVLINSEKSACITDMGLVSISASNAFATTHKALSAGSARWMAPELLLDDIPRNYSSDVYAYGMTLYEVLCGKIPFYELSEPMSIMAISSGRRPHRPDVNDPTSRSMSDKTWGLMEACCATDPSDRIDMSEVLKRSAEL